MASISLQSHVSPDIRTLQNKISYSLSIQPNKPLPKRIKTSLNGFGVAFKTGFSPSKGSAFVDDFDEKPSRRNAEVFDADDLHLLPIGGYGCVGCLLQRKVYSTCISAIEMRATRRLGGFWAESEKLLPLLFRCCWCGRIVG